MKPCEPGKTRNPKTKRCRKNINYEPCKSGKIRDPITHRCRKSGHKSRSNDQEFYTPNQSITQKAKEIYKPVVSPRQDALIKIRRNLTQKRVAKLKTAIKTRFLKSICSDSGVCIAFGKESDTIKRFFDGFTNFKWAVDPIKRIGAPSANGFVNEINYVRDNYKSNTVLKSSAQKNADNLMYEYVVGVEYINKMTKRYPCFLETYGLFEYKSTATMNTMKKNTVNKIKRLENLNTIPVSWANACKHSAILSILIQHLKDARKILSIAYPYETMYILFQIYIPLALLADTFTHYDLHNENVLVYEPIKGKHIQYRYHLPSGKIIEFNSPYIVKIIDYGRSYFNNGSKTGRDVYDDICADCKNCGEYKGFGWNGPPEPDYFISASTRNISHDLRLLHILKTQINAYDINELTQHVKYDDDYGTQEIINSNWTQQGDPIENVKDVLKWIQDYHTNNLQPQGFLPENRIGILNVYHDRDMEFQEK